MEYFGARGVVEAHMAKLNLLAQTIERLGIGGVDNGLGLLKELLQTVDTGTTFLHLRDGGGEFLGRGNHEDKHHDVGNKKLGREPRIAPQHHGGAEKKDANNHTVA